MRTVVFDLDGTLADTSGDLIAAANVCFQKIGIEGLDPVRDTATAVRGGRAMLRLGLSRVGREHDEALIDAYYPVLLSAYETAIDTHTRFFPNALRAVSDLRSRGDKAVICTNKPEHLARILLTNMGVIDQFDCLIGANTLPTRKPDPAPYIAAVEQVGGTIARSCMIGDTLTDHKTARAVGVPSVLVDFSFGDEDVHALNPDAILSDFSELIGVIDQLLP